MGSDMDNEIGDDIAKDLSAARHIGERNNENRKRLHAAIVNRTESLQDLLGEAVVHQGELLQSLARVTTKAIMTEDAALAQQILSLIGEDHVVESLRRIVEGQKHDAFARNVDPDFQCQVVGQPSRMVPLDSYRPQLTKENALDWVDARASDVLESTPLADIDGEAIVAYMMRRFGYPNCDEWSEPHMTPSWLLDTPHPKLLLLVRPHHSGAFSFAPFVRVDTDRTWGFETTRAEFDALSAAYRTALMDLTRAVRMQDVWMNALGQDWAETYLNMGRSDDEDGPDFEAEVRDYMNGIPAGLADGDRWHPLLRALQKAGDGDFDAGVDKAIELMEAAQPTPKV